MQLICWGVPCCPVDHGPPVVLVFMFCFVVVVLFSPDDAQFPGPSDFSPFTLKFIDAMLLIHSLFDLFFWLFFGPAQAGQMQ